MRRCQVFLILIISSCIDDPSTKNPIGVTAQETSAPADGATIVPLTVTAATDGPVALIASTGSFVNATVSGSGAPSSTTVSTARGSTTIDYRTGLDVGTAVITASAGSGAATFSFTFELPLTPNAPTGLTLTPDRTVVPADGVSFVTLKIAASVPAPSLVSHGTPVQLGACCASSSDEPIPCNAGKLPFRVPASVTIDNGRDVTVQALTNKLTAAGAGSGSGQPADVDAFLIARPGSDAVDCGALTGTSTLVEVALTPQ